MNARVQKIEKICRKYQIEALYVFGSRSAELLHAIQDDQYQLVYHDVSADELFEICASHLGGC